MQSRCDGDDVSRPEMAGSASITTLPCRRVCPAARPGAQGSGTLVRFAAVLAGIDTPAGDRVALGNGHGESGRDRSPKGPVDVHDRCEDRADVQAESSISARHRGGDGGHRRTRRHPGGPRGQRHHMRGFQPLCCSRRRQGSDGFRRRRQAESPRPAGRGHDVDRRCRPCRAGRPRRGKPVEGPMTGTSGLGEG